MDKPPKSAWRANDFHLLHICRVDTWRWSCFRDWVPIVDATATDLPGKRQWSGGGDTETTTAADRHYSRFLLGITVAKGHIPFQRKDGDHQI
jgi:hypothetical protein